VEVEAVEVVEVVEVVEGGRGGGRMKWKGADAAEYAEATATSLAPSTGIWRCPKIDWAPSEATARKGKVEAIGERRGRGPV